MHGLRTAPGVRHPLWRARHRTRALTLCSLAPPHQGRRPVPRRSFRRRPVSSWLLLWWCRKWGPECREWNQPARPAAAVLSLHLAPPAGLGCSKLPLQALPVPALRSPPSSTPGNPVSRPPAPPAPSRVLCVLDRCEPPAARRAVEECAPVPCSSARAAAQEPAARQQSPAERRGSGALRPLRDTAPWRTTSGWPTMRPPSRPPTTRCSSSRRAGGGRARRPCTLLLAAGCRRLAP